jgi:predicted DNA-binding transcriptional regulator AlpA
MPATNTSNNNNNEPERFTPLWNAADIAAWAGLSVGTIRNWQHEGGRLPAPRRIGRAVRWNAADVLEWFPTGSAAA